MPANLKLITRDSLMLQEGQLLGPYVVLARLGAEGGHDVYLALEPTTGARVRLTHLAAAPTRRQERAQRLRLLIAASRLTWADEPALAPVLEVGRFGGRAYLAEGHLAGPTLAEWLSAERRPVGEILARFTEVARGLAAAHALGAVHGNFSAAQVRVGPGGAVVVGFGLPGAGEPSARADQQAFAAALCAALTGSAGAVANLPPHLRGPLAEGLAGAHENVQELLGWLEVRQAA